MIQLKQFPRYYTDGIDLYTKKESKYFAGKYRKINGWKLTYMNEWRYYVTQKYRNNQECKFIFRKDLPNYLLPKVSNALALPIHTPRPIIS